MALFFYVYAFFSLRKVFYFFFFAYENIQITMKINARMTRIPRTAFNAPETR